MDRRGFLQVTLSTTLGLASGMGMGAQAGPAGSWTLADAQLKIDLSGESKGGLSGFTDLQSHRNFIAKRAPLYRLSLLQKGQPPLELTSLDAESIKVEQSSAHQRENLTLTYGRHRALDLTVVCDVQ